MWLKSIDSTWQLRASPSRVDAHWIRSVDGDERTDVVEHCIEVLGYLMQQLNLGIGRIALIFNRFCEADEPTNALIQRFTNNGAQAGPFHNSSNFEIHNHKLYVLRGLDIPVNSWVRCRIGIVQPSQVQAVTVEQDINTLGEEIDSRVFSVDEFAQFVREAEGEMENILGLYFPEGE